MERLVKFADFLTKDPSLPIDITAAVLTGRKRTFSSDSERLAIKFEKPVVLGAENIPTDPTPVIIACNHPNLYDLAVGTVNITRIFSRRRREEGLPGKIRWMVAQNLVSKGSSPVDQKIVFPAINRALKIIHQTYDFIPVPLNYLNPQKRSKERAIVLFAARKHLKTSPYSTIGIFPEGDFEQVEPLRDFYGGVGVLCRFIGTEVTVLPVGIYRSIQNKLAVNFGQILRIDPGNNAEEITHSIKTAVKALKKSK